MKKLFVFAVLILIITSSQLFAAYNVGDVVANYFWTDNTGTSHDIYELTDQCTAIVFFWGGAG